MPCDSEEKNIKQRGDSGHRIEICVNVLHVGNDFLNVNFENVDVYEEGRKAYYRQNERLPSDLVFR
jgi:hypothetical protein